MRRERRKGNRGCREMERGRERNEGFWLTIWQRQRRWYVYASGRL